MRTSSTTAPGWAASACSPCRVLIVDDDASAASALSEVVGSLGHQPRVATDAHTAMAMAAEHAPHIALVSTSLPGASAVAVARALRERTVGRPLVLVAMSGRDGGGSHGGGAFDHHLMKPVYAASLSMLLDGSPAPFTPGRLARDSRTSLLARLVADADTAVHGGDASAFAAAIRAMFGLADEALAFELVAVAELAHYDLELAAVRWSKLRPAL